MQSKLFQWNCHHWSSHVILWCLFPPSIYMISFIQLILYILWGFEATADHKLNFLSAPHFNVALEQATALSQVAIFPGSFVMTLYNIPQTLKNDKKTPVIHYGVCLSTLPLLLLGETGGETDFDGIDALYFPGRGISLRELPQFMHHMTDQPLQIGDGRYSNSKALFRGVCCLTKHQYGHKYWSCWWWQLHNSNSIANINGGCWNLDSSVPLLKEQHLKDIVLPITGNTSIWLLDDWMLLPNFGWASHAVKIVVSKTRMHQVKQVASCDNLHCQS